MAATEQEINDAYQIVGQRDPLPTAAITRLLAIDVSNDPDETGPGVPARFVGQRARGRVRMALEAELPGVPLVSPQVAHVAAALRRGQGFE